ncbi:hypothetical protein [Kordiimonas pumila]|uniref:Uncharacterized protein n=1 Tax=Kordiimonas pumila TaxID=2161677 RepID=A0ABV7D117_9PROT|nr:hypothetical protein [Kordiimonas pumila]
MQLETFLNVELAPWKIIKKENKALFAGGLANPENFPKFARHHRGKKVADISAEGAKSPSHTLKGKYVWGGHYHPHFGHFIAEFVHRLWVC